MASPLNPKHIMCLESVKVGEFCQEGLKNGHNFPEADSQ